MYVLKMNRYGDSEKHSYIVGVYSNFETAEYAGLIEEYWRGGKYTPDCKYLGELDVIDEEKKEWFLENVVGKE